MSRLRSNHPWIFTPLLLALGGCVSSHKAIEANNQLRFQVIDLQNQIAALEKRNQELQAELQASSQAPQSLPEDIRANMPAVVQISIGRLSFASDTDNDGVPDRITIYLHPEDGLARFEQLVGSITATATVIPQQGEPTTIGRIELNPAQVRDCYRSSFTGTHYTIELPIQLPPTIDPRANDAFVRVVYNDGRTGRSLTAERIIKLGQPHANESAGEPTSNSR